MPKYIVQRNVPDFAGMSQDQWRQKAGQSNRVLSNLGEIQWVESFICSGAAFCIYIAPDEGLVREHSRVMGAPIHAIHEVERVVDPTVAEDAERCGAALAGVNGASADAAVLEEAAAESGADDEPAATDLCRAMEDARTQAALAYDAAADTFDHPANTFWGRFGEATVRRLNLLPGERVLDVCCGTGASALPAAEAVGGEGRVLGIDVSRRMLQFARAKARRRALCNVDFCVEDMMDLDLEDGSFDAVVCVFGIFFCPDMPRAVAELWRHVRPGGRMAVTTWGPGFFEPANGAFWRAVSKVRPDLYKEFNPWERIDDPSSLWAMLAEGGVICDDIEAVEAHHEIEFPGDWWAAVMGSGLRGTVERLRPEERDAVREASLAYVRDRRIDRIETNVIYAVAHKPA